MGEVDCPECEGRGTNPAFVDTATKGWFDPALKCSMCGGAGRIAEIKLDWLIAGRVHYRKRVEREETIMACGRRLGYSPSEISAMEHGRADPTPLQADYPPTPDDAMREGGG